MKMQQLIEAAFADADGRLLVLRVKGDADWDFICLLGDELHGQVRSALMHADLLKLSGRIVVAEEGKAYPTAKRMLDMRQRQRAARITAYCAIMWFTISKNSIASD